MGMALQRVLGDIHGRAQCDHLELSLARLRALELQLGLVDQLAAKPGRSSLHGRLDLRRIIVLPFAYLRILLLQVPTDAREHLRVVRCLLYGLQRAVQLLTPRPRVHRLVRTIDRQRIRPDGLAELACGPLEFLARLVHHAKHPYALASALAPACTVEEEEHLARGIAQVPRGLGLLGRTWRLRPLCRRRQKRWWTAPRWRAEIRWRTPRIRWRDAPRGRAGRCEAALSRGLRPRPWRIASKHELG